MFDVSSFSSALQVLGMVFLVGLGTGTIARLLRGGVND